MKALSRWSAAQPALELWSVYARGRGLAHLFPQRQQAVPTQTPWLTVFCPDAFFPSALPGFLSKKAHTSSSLGHLAFLSKVPRTHWLNGQADP